jgi:CRP/FNR family cyclic AMP-dependent transcriptional regulator
VIFMACNVDVLDGVPLFSLLDSEEKAMLAAKVDLQSFAPWQRIYKRGEPGGRGYVLVSGAVRVTTIDADEQEVVVEEPDTGDFFGFASMLDGTPHQTDAAAIEETVCVEVDREDILALIQQRPHAGIDLLTATARRLHAAHQLVRGRSARNPNDVIEGDDFRATDRRSRGAVRGFVVLHHHIRSGADRVFGRQCGAG